MKKVSNYIPALTGVRAIAAFLVFFHHYNQQDFAYPLLRTLNELHVGVTVFFVLSGFLICLRYYDNYEISGTWFRRYLKNRVARIYPMYALLTLATFGVAVFLGDKGYYNGFPYPLLLLFLNLFFFRGFFDDLKFTGVGQGWSLTVEECFYFLAPLFFHRIKQHKAALLYLPLLLIGAGVLLVLLGSRLPPGAYGFFGNFRFMFLYTFLGRCVEFFAGMALAMVVLRKPVARISLQLPLFTLLGSAAVAACVWILTQLPLEEGHAYGLYHPLGIVTNNLLLPIAITGLFYGLINESSLFRRWLSSAHMQLLGKASYIFYLIHIGFIANYVTRFTRYCTDSLFGWFEEKEYDWWNEHLSDTWINILLAFVLLNLVAIVLYRFVEEPANHCIRQSAFLEKNKKKQWFKQG